MGYVGSSTTNIIGIINPFLLILIIAIFTYLQS